MQTKRAKVLFEEHRQRIFKETDRLFAYLMVLQWIAAILTALIISPRAWYGTVSRVHIHVWTAIFLGGTISAYPLFLAIRYPGAPITRYVIGVAQMLWSAILIHLTGGRIETHFHVFGSLAFLAFYRDWTVLIPATVVVATDHFVRGIVWPQSVYGVLSVSPWRWLEHAWWVIFEDAFLFISCRRSVKEMWRISDHTAKLEMTNQIIEAEVAKRTEELQTANQRLKAEIREREIAEHELQEAQTQLIESEKTATVAHLAAGAAHEVKNPLAIIRQGVDFLSSETSGMKDKRVTTEVLGDMSNAVNRADFIIRGLLDVSSQSKFNPAPEDLNKIINQAFALTKNQLDRKRIRLARALDAGLPAVRLDKNRVIQVFINLIDNAVDAMQDAGVITVKTYVKNHNDLSDSDRASFKNPDKLIVAEIFDTGSGILEGSLEQVFEPFFTTKRNIGGVGLGLVIARSIIQMHGGSIQIKNRVGAEGTCVSIFFPFRVDMDKQAA